MAVHVYEGMFILDSARFGREGGKLTENLQNMVESRGAEILVSRLWEERRLAYPINGQRKGTYWLMYVKMDGNHLADINVECGRNDWILRVLFLKVDPRIADTLVEHARAGHIVQSAGEAGASEESESEKESSKPAADSSEEEAKSSETVDQTAEV